MLKKVRWTIVLGSLISAFLLGTSVYGADREEEKITMRLMHYLGDEERDLLAAYLAELLENEFPKLFPNVELVQEIYDNQTYKTKIKVLMAADEEPDIMFMYGGGFSEAFVKAGKVLALDEYLSDFYKEHINMEMQENFIYDDQLYGICYSYWTGVLYCNQELFDQIGAEIPQTYEELIEVSHQFREAGIEPVACGMLDKWNGQQWINNFTIQLGGAELCNAMAKGEESMDNEILAQAAQLTANLVEEGVFCSNMYQITSDQAEVMFLNEEAAMFYLGTWYTSSAESYLGEKLAVAKMPVVLGAMDSQDYHGAAINGWMVSADTQYPEVAAEIAAWLAYQIDCYQQEFATFTVEEEDKKQEISDASQKILDLYVGKENGGAAWDTLLTSDETEIWLDMCAKLFEGKVDGQEFAQTLGELLG